MNKDGGTFSSFSRKSKTSLDGNCFELVDMSDDGWWTAETKTA